MKQFTKFAIHAAVLVAICTSCQSVEKKPAEHKTYEASQPADTSTFKIGDSIAIASLHDLKRLDTAYMAYIPMITYQKVQDIMQIGFHFYQSNKPDTFLTVTGRQLVTLDNDFKQRLTYNEYVAVSTILNKLLQEIIVRYRKAH